MSGTTVGFQVLTADGAVQSSGKSVVVYGISYLSGATAGVVILRSGTSTAGTAVIQSNGTISSGTTIFSNVGVVFPSGCFVDIDANLKNFDVFYEAI